MTAGIVAWRDHHLFSGSVASNCLSRCPMDRLQRAPITSRDETHPSLAAILAQFRDTTPKSITTVLQTGVHSLFNIAGRPWLSKFSS